MNTKYTTLEMLPAVLSIVELADLLQIKKNSTYGLIKEGEIKSIRIGNQIRISKKCLIDYLDRAGE